MTQAACLEPEQVLLNTRWITTFMHPWVESCWSGELSHNASGERQEGRINIQEHIAESQSVCKHIRLLKFPYFIHQAVSVHAPFSLSKVVPECWQYSSQPSKIDCNGFNSRLVIGYIPKVLDLVRLLGCCRQIICCSEWGADDPFTFWKIQGPFGCLGVWGLWLHTVRLRMAYN